MMVQPVHCRRLENRGEETHFLSQQVLRGGSTRCVDVTPQCGEGDRHGAGLITFVRASKKPLRSDLRGLHSEPPFFSPHIARSRFRSCGAPSKGQRDARGEGEGASSSQLI